MLAEPHRPQRHRGVGDADDGSAVSVDDCGGDGPPFALPSDRNAGRSVGGRSRAASSVAAALIFGAAIDAGGRRSLLVVMFCSAVGLMATGDVQGGRSSADSARRLASSTKC